VINTTLFEKLYTILIVMWNILNHISIYRITTLTIYFILS